jgi:multiple antibiotic resistance protein
MSLHAYILLTFSSLFIIVDPIAALPAFLSMTPQDSPASRIRMARLACCVAGGVLIVCAATGKWLFRLLGITLPAFQMGGSIVLLLVALDMLRARRSEVRETSEETAAGADKEDIAITPLAIPMLAGPGAISTTILLQNEAHNVPQHIALYGCILAVAVASYLIFRLAVRSAHWLNPIAMSIAIRVMGLLLAAVAIQFMLNGIKSFRLELISAPTL